MKAIDSGPLEHGQVRAPVVVAHDVEEIGRVLLAAVLAQKREQESLVEAPLLPDRRVRSKVPSQDDRPGPETSREGERLHVELAAPVEIGRVEDVGSCR